MALRTLRLHSDEILRKKSKIVSKITPNILTLLDDMRETMIENNGIGLAAPQVGILRRVVVIDINDELLELINPEILEMSGSQLDSEGCLSIPGKSGKVERPEFVKFKAQNRLGEEIIREATGLLAVAVCHEVDHLEGILFTDKVIELFDDADLDEDFNEETD